MLRKPFLLILLLVFPILLLAQEPTAEEMKAIEAEAMAAEMTSSEAEAYADEMGQSATGAIVEVDVLDKGDTAWIIAASALVLFMTIPGLSLFYAGLVAKRNVLSVLMQCLALTGLMTVIWLVCGYSLAFGDGGGMHAFIGGFDKAFLLGVTPDTLSGSIPEILFFLFQMTFFIITPALMVGAFVERMKFSAILIFCAVWGLVVYLPICHMVWGGEGTWFGDMGVFDFAGGIVVHITAGIGALVACIMVGPRSGFGKQPMPPHNLPMTVTGTGMLWVGWYGFNGGSQLAADGGAVSAIVVTQISASVAALTWMAIEWRKHGKPSVLGTATGAIAGLAAITPASGFVGPIGALIIGAVSGVVCWYFSTVIKIKRGYDDSLDVFGVHGVGGFVGTLLVAFLASETFGGNQGDLNMGKQFGVQLFASVFTIIYTLIATWIILKVVDKLVGLRVANSEENEGLDIASHGEAGYEM